jgi:ABC-type iron transport system FetAB ATPase subunit
VLIDGIDIKELNLRWLRQQIALVSQEPALFTACTPIRLSCKHALRHLLCIGCSSSEA